MGLDLERLAQEAWEWNKDGGQTFRYDHFAALVLEEAAKVCESGQVPLGMRYSGESFAAAIRALKPAASPPRP